MTPVPRVSLLSVLSVLLAFCLGPPALAQTRDIIVEPSRIVYQGKALYERPWAVLIGINRYPHPRVPPEDQDIGELGDRLAKLQEEARREAERRRAEDERRAQEERGRVEREERSFPPDNRPMVLVPAGEFTMGDNHGDGDSDERPSRRVYLDAFYIDKYPVTNEEYRKFTEATGHRKPTYWGDANFNGPKQPVVGISWDDAAAYCRWAGKRLPTEAEWEKAARGPDGRKYPWGNEWDPGKAIFSGNSGGKTHPVDRTYNTHRSPYGAADMSGNVWQWVADSYDPGYYRKGENRNPKGPASGSARVLRGGSWSDVRGYLRAPDRDNNAPSIRTDYIGARCAGAP